MPGIITRAKYRLLFLFQHHKELNRRAQVEQWLFQCAAGKKPLPDENTCKWLALRLGTPKEDWAEYLQNPPSKE